MNGHRPVREATTLAPSGLLLFSREKRSIRGVLARPIAYSYARFSTPEQERGDSERRQIEAARQYAEQHGFVLDESIVVDRGISAFAGKNVSEGALGEFIKRVERKNIGRGSALFVEIPRPGKPTTIFGVLAFIPANSIRRNRDSFSVHWASAKTQSHLCRCLANRGGNRPRQLRKSGEIAKTGAAWGQKKHHSPEGLAITNKLPGWLDGKTGSPMTVNKAKAKVVQRIFEMAASGLGKRPIARRLNQEKVPTFGQAPTWGQSYVQKILFNRATLGEYQPHKIRSGRRQPEGDLRPAFYPAVITAELWDRAHKSIATRVTTTARGKITGKFASRTGALHNLFAGLV
jgi:hypothetical protein